MKLLVISHKTVWRDSDSPLGYATDGGFPFQMSALSELFDSTTLAVPCLEGARPTGLIPLQGRNLSITPLSEPRKSGWKRKFEVVLPWLLKNGSRLWHQAMLSDAIHLPLPGDVGTIGLAIAHILGKPFFVRYCGNWYADRSLTERLIKAYMRRSAGGKRVMLATGGAKMAPSSDNPNLDWIFATSLTEQELEDCACRPQPSLDQPRMIIVGRQEYAKGTHLVIRSLAELVQEFPTVSLDVVGDGPDLNDFQRISAELGLNGRVKFYGSLPHGQVLALLKRSSLFCFPTHSEGFPKSVLEALACGLPVITTPVSVLPFLIDHNQCGLILSERNARAVTDAVSSLLKDGTLYQKMASNALRTARGFSLEAWQEAIGNRLRSAWGPLRSNG